MTRPGTLLLLMLASFATRAEEAPLFSAQELKTIFTMSPVPPTPRDTTNRVDGDANAIAFGRVLFFSPRLSGDGRFSCASCHDPNRGWTDGKPVATAVGVGTRNTPSLWNVAQNRWFFWDGHADSLWSQALKPIENELEQNGTRLQVVHVVTEDPGLRSLYAKVFGAVPDVTDLERFPKAGSPVSTKEELQTNWWRMEPADQDTVNRIYSNVGKAIAAFEATIVAGAAPFDRFVADLRGGKKESQAISVSAQRGLKIFIGKGDCVLCHSGPHFTNKEFHDIRVPQLKPNEPDDGRNHALEHLAEDEFVAAGPYSDDPQGTRAQLLYFVDAQANTSGHFKTPGLRNVATTAPYMHAGQFQTLRDVVHYYSTLEGAVAPLNPAHVETLIRPLKLTDQEIDDLVAFMESLTSDPVLFADPSRSADR